ncbi:CTP synthase [Clarias magur]|uniref:CTP synthase n=1 Tax=Clarias magur TaxID=1594786 RepID=A0A8J4U1L7_CLAMG|nr:CTP synthase [Clarias magur]
MKYTARECRGLCSLWGPSPAEWRREKKKKKEAGNHNPHQRGFLYVLDDSND